MSKMRLDSRIRAVESADVPPLLHELVTVNEDPDERSPKLSLIIPTRNETRNIEPLLDQLKVALGAIPAEVIFVDDSDDDTAEEIDRVGAHDAADRAPDPASLRTSAKAVSGTAVVSGMKAATVPGPW